MKYTKQDGSFGSLLGMKLLECSQNLAELKSKILTFTEVANLISVSRRTCTNYRNELKIPFVHIDAKTVFIKSEVLMIMHDLKDRGIEKGPQVELRAVDAALTNLANINAMFVEKHEIDIK